MSVTKEELDKYNAAYMQGHPLISDDVNEMEVWKDISYRDIKSNRYQVSNYGRIRRKDTLKLMTPDIRNNGYAYVRLVIGNGGSSRMFTIHRIVAYHFCEGHDVMNANIVNHIDGIKLNNFYKNLEWCDQKHNAQHAFDIGLHKPSYGDESSRHVISNKLAERICKMLIKYHGSIKPILNILSDEGIYCTFSIIESIKQKETWIHISDKYFRKNYFTDLIENDIRNICELIVKYNGDTDLVLQHMKPATITVNRRMINEIIEKSRYVKISDEYFQKDDYLREKYFSEDEIREICNTLIKYKGDVNMTNNVLKDTIPNITPKRVSDIKHKGSYTKISDEYFDQGQFRQIDVDVLDFVRELLMTHTFGYSPTKLYESLNHEKYSRLTLSVIRMIGNCSHAIYNGYKRIPINKYMENKKTLTYVCISKEMLDKLILSYSDGFSDITDSAYDLLLEEYLKVYGEDKRPFLRVAQTDSIKALVGTLGKCFGVTQTMRPDQKSYDDWVKTNKLDPDMKIVVQPKFDGCSIAYDAKEHRYFKRGDYDNGESEEVTNIFEKMYFWDKEFVDNTCEGSKFEMMMGVDIHQKYFKEYETPRDAAVAYIRKAQKNPSFDPFDANRTLVLVPLRDMINGKQYIPSYLENISLKTTVGDYDSIQRFINELLSNGAVLDLGLGACQMGNLEYVDTYKCDGVVVSVLDEDDSIVKEVAIKIIHDVHEAKLLDIEYQFGNTGKITPVAKISPTAFADGKRTVTSITLSTLDRVKKMNLRHNDTVHVMYNIVPYFIDSKHDGDYPFNIPHKCPICGADLDMSHLETVRCMNPECSGRKIGDITRYCISMRMLGISEATITKLFEAGKVTCISDLYTLTKEDIMSIDGYREKSADNIIRIIWNAAQDCPVSRWLGALPFKDISSKKWDTLLNIFIGNDEMLKSSKMRNYIENESSDFLSDIMSTYFVGIGPLTLAAINEGWMRNIDEMRKIIKNISFRVTTVSSNKPITTYVTFTGCRDTELVEWLNKKGIGVIDFGSKTQYLIIPNKEYQNKKTHIAKSKGLHILTIDEVKDFFKPF